MSELHKNGKTFFTNSQSFIFYYGAEYGEMRALEEGQSFILDDLFEAFLLSWEKATAYPQSQVDPLFDLDNDPTFGQAAVTAMIVQDYFGGSIHNVKTDCGGSHYFNKINDHFIDLTRDQFDLYDLAINYEPNETIDRAYFGKSEDTQSRYQLLKMKVEKCLLKGNE